MDREISERVKILVIDDEEPIRRFLTASLETGEYQVIEAANGQIGIHAAVMHNPKLILLDLGLPDIDGLELTKEIRTWSQIPIIILSARGQESDKIKALDYGADDYITKPFSIGELLARIRVALRNTSHLREESLPVFDNGTIRVNFTTREVFREDTLVHLTPTEYKLLTVLTQSAGRVITHTQLLTKVWGEQQAEELHYLRIYMKQLRHKLEKDPARPAFFTTEPGIGYRFRT